ncbi:hypothetical protein GQ44DRAFT_701150 [Phaeosphaeriaceae sp. PMI808]|nr:hypothetical protein GQ44DRAFT_701150 [Phaeosphaeriaceae sp. PMI808]
MKFSGYFVATAATLVNFALGMPADIEVKSINPDHVLTKRANSANCALQWCGKPDRNGNTEVHVNTNGYWANDWGQGLLDNLRGQCGDVYGWGFDYDGGDNSRGGHARFWIPFGRPCGSSCGNNGGVCSYRCVEDAIWRASAGTGAITLTCSVS